MDTAKGPFAITNWRYRGQYLHSRKNDPPEKKNMRFCYVDSRAGCSGRVGDFWNQLDFIYDGGTYPTKNFWSTQVFSIQVADHYVLLVFGRRNPSGSCVCEPDRKPAKT